MKEDRIYIGDLMRKVINKQKENVKNVTYNVCEISDKEACELLATKILAGDKVF
jgi:hypothetical protein